MRKLEELIAVHRQQQEKGGSRKERVMGPGKGSAFSL